MSGRPAIAATLRPLDAADLPALARLEDSLFGPAAWSRGMLAEELAAPDRWYIAAESSADDERGGRLDGYAGLWFDGEDAQVMTIGVARERQGRGIGALLLGALIGRARELGARSMLLEVRVDNAPALALYARFGFERMGRRRGYYQPENVDAWTMRCPLNGASSTPTDAEERP